MTAGGPHRRPEPRDVPPEWVPEAIAQAPDVIFVTDRQNRIAYIGRAITGMLGRSPAELIGDTILAIVAPRDHAAILDGLYEARAGGDTRELVDVGCMAAGVVEPVLVEIALRRVVVDNTVMGCVGVARDVSGRNERLNARLASERVAAVSDLAQQTAHNVNNPLAILTVHLGVIEKAVTEGRPPTAEAVQQMREVVDRIAQAIRDLATAADTTIQKSILGTPVADLAGPPETDRDHE